MFVISSVELDALIAQYALPFLRLFALLVAAPVFSQRVIPVRLKIGFAMLGAALIAPLAEIPPGLEGATLALAAAKEIVVGAGIGIALQALFACATLAGDLIGLQMGLAFASFYDPATSAQTPLTGSLLGLAATLVFLAINGHLQVLAGLAASFDTLPIGSSLPAASAGALAALGGELLKTGLHLALPVLTALLVMNIALGVMGRAAPQFNLFAVGFPITLAVGMLGLLLAMPMIGSALVAVLERAVPLAFQPFRAS